MALILRGTTRSRSSSTEEERSPTKLARIGAPALGRACSLTYPKIPRPKDWDAGFSTSAPRTAVGINEYLYALSQRGHGAVRAGGRRGDTRWELEPTAADPPLAVLVVKMHQQFESPPAVVATVRRLWQPSFDAMATPFSAVCADYATIEDDVLVHGVVPSHAVVYTNPAYAPADLSNGAAGIELHLSKLVETDVRQRGCTLVALLPNLSHTEWHERLVGRAHEIHFIKGGLVFPNPFTDVGQRKKGYLWESRSYMLCVWRPTAPPSQPALSWLKLDAAPQERIELRTCRVCGCVRVLPRWADASSAVLRADRFVCSSSPDKRYNSCASPEFVIDARK